MTKPRQTKPWPDLVGLLPLLKSADAPVIRGPTHIHLDMTYLRHVDAIGLAIFLARLIQSYPTKGNSLVLTPPSSEMLRIRLNELQFDELLSGLEVAVSPHRDLFSQFFPSSPEPGAEAIPKTLYLEKIIRVSPKADECRASQLADVKAQIKSFLSGDVQRSLAHEQLMIILLELVKNTLDHSGKPALIGLRLKPLGEEGRDFSFVYCDSGDGICHSVRRHMEERSNEEKSTNPTNAITFERLAKKGSFTDLMHWALQPGHTTKSGNGINLGLGLMLIIQAAKNFGCRLSIRDADTMLTLTDLVGGKGGESASPYTHSLIRQLGVKMSSSPLLMFYGELE